MGVQAAPPRAFDVAAQPLNQALLDLAIQADISIGLGEVGGCRHASRGARGELTLSEALDRVLAGTGCAWQPVDASSVRIVRLPPPPPALARPEARAAPPQRIGARPAAALVPEVVVTATRRSALAMRLPDAISAISGVRMAEDRVSSIGDLAGQAAGLTVTNLGPGSDKTIIRGLSDGGLTGHAQSMVGLYLDDTRLTYNAPDPDLRLTDIGQVEVLQGPQGALYGAGSIAGVVHIVSRQPNLTRLGGMLSVTGAASPQGGPSGVIEGVANVPIAPGRAALRVVAYDEHDGGYVDDVLLGRKNANSTDRVGTRLSLKASLNSDWSVELGGVHQTLTTADSQYSRPHLGAYQRDVLVSEPHSNDFDEVHLTLAGDVPAGRFRNTLSLLRHEVDTRYDASSALPLLILAPIAPSAYDEADRIDTLVDEATLTSVGAGRLQWLLGGFASASREGLDSAITTRPLDGAPDAPIYTEHRTDSIQQLALYGEATYDITPRLAVEAGARVGVIDVSTRSVVRAPTSGDSAAFRGRMSDFEWAPKLSIRYQVGPEAMVYGLVSEGARGGGFNTGAPIGTVFDGPDGHAEPFRRFKGDELWNFEAGVKVRTLSDRLDLRATAFYALWSNIQSDQLLPSGLAYTANIGDGRNFGLELELAYAIGGLELRLASVLDEPELTRHTSPFPSLLHSGLPGAPRGSVGASVHYKIAAGGRFQPFFDASVDYVGQSRLNFDDRISRRMGDYALARVTLGADAGAWRVSAFTDNPFGVVGDTFAFGNPFSLRRFRQITPLPPPSAGLQLTRSF
jgi:outer membrane receptor protein involved in Fe transport